MQTMLFSKITKGMARINPGSMASNPIATVAKRLRVRQGSRSRAKILIHAINFAPELIGCGKYTTELAQYLSGRGHEVEVVTAPPHYPGWYVRKPYRAYAYASEILDGVRVTRCPMAMKADGSGLWRLLAPMSFAIAAAPMLIWRVLRFRPDVVLCVEPTLFAAPLALLLAKFLGASSVLHVQDLEVDAAFAVGHIDGAAIKKTGFYFERLLLRGFDRIVTISHKMRAALVDKGLDRAKVAMLRNWVDTNAITPAPKTPNSFRVELGLKSDDFVVLYAGNIGVKQALDVVVDAARLLKDKSDIYFVIAGAGPEKAALQRASKCLPNVLHLPLQPVERLNELLALADLHVLPQHKGAADLVLPSKLCGMLASGRPVVATADEGTELFDLLTDVALLTPSGEPRALAEAIAGARHADLSAEVKKGLRLVENMDTQRVLPQFEAALLDPLRHPAPVVVVDDAVELV